MAKMGRRKRSRLITQGLLTSGKTRPQEAVRAPAEPVVAQAEAAEAAAPAAAAPAQAAAAVSGEPDIKALSERVKARRKENGWTQADVARKGGPAAGAISQIERCLMESPAEDVLAKLDTALEWPAGTAEGILRGAESELVGAAG
ncbi:helix-turn-helix domain-containing protein [Nocardia yamanashiensis]|uniref:helix-turn-helix domain-containing protein n=1 Tax=Nocardia yamanashiensis TaxID=209247 RepID=UPI001E5AD980|nr:helix-turn-helix domain-containing protein [Nocardia yamanashiensis]UGT42828.1 helix-turn-helix domain-containing protein [Nocardia yamanashiensis]